MIGQGFFRSQKDPPMRRAASSTDAATRGKLEYLSASELFGDLNPTEMQELDRMTTMTSCRRGKVFFESGQVAEVLFLLKRGRVTLYRLNAEGKRLVTASVDPGTLFGEMPLLGQSMYGSYAEATEDCLLCVMGREDLQQLLVRKPTVALRVVELLSRRVGELEARLESMVFKGVPARLAAVLLKSADPAGPATIRISHQDLADMVGTYRETVTRILDEWQQQGLIGLGRMRITIADLAALEVIASA